MTHELRDHWDRAYALGDHTRSWFQEEAAPSVAAFDAAGVTPADSVIDVGGGASRLVEGLLDLGFDDVTVLDVSPAAIQIARTRAGLRAARVTWLVTDLLEWIPTRTYAVWHDRAVLHFLVTDEDQRRYAAALDRATEPGSVAVIAGFAPDGPTQCSGLPTARHDEVSLAALVGPKWELASSGREVHRTPNDAEQSFLWTTFHRIG